MNRRGLLIAAVILLPLAALTAWWFVTFERVEGDVDVPLRGEASYNPLYGLKKVLQARGIEVVSRANLNLQAMALESDDTLVLTADVRTLTKDQVDELLDWIDTGGQLIFSLPPGSEGRGGELMDALGIFVLQRSTCLRWPALGTADGGEHCFAFSFKFEKVDQSNEFTLLTEDGKGGYYLARHARGNGAWFVAGDLNFLSTEALKQSGNAELAWQVIGPALQGGKVHLVYSADVPPLYVLLVERGWPALLPVLLALLAWLWARSQRFGPLLPLAAAHRRALREHVEAAGEFTFRRGRAAALYAPLRRAFIERLRRDDQTLGSLDDEALAQALATRNKRPLAEIRQALNPVDLNRPEQFLATIKTLTELSLSP
jgi:hypothetical protein